MKGPGGSNDSPFAYKNGMQSIAFINNHFPALSATFIYREVLGLRRRGVPIKTYSIRRPSAGTLSEESLDLLNSTTYLLPVAVRDFIAAHLHFIARGPIGYLRVFLFLMTRKYVRPVKDRLRTCFHFCEGVHFAKMIRDDGNIAHIHAHYASHPCTVALVASMLTGIPFSFTGHAYDIYQDRLFLSDKVNAARFVITCSHYGRQATLDEGGIQDPEKVRTIYHGIDTGKFSPRVKGRDRSRIRLLNVGRLSEEKRQRDLITACGALRRDGYSLECEIVGDGPLFKELLEYVALCGLKSEVKLAGAVYQEEIREYYARADILVVSSGRGVDNLPNVLVEGMAMGLPVVATDIGGVSELVIDRVTGILVPPHDPGELAAGIKTLIDDPGLAQKVAENGRKQVCAYFDENDSLDKLTELYSEVLGGRKRSAANPAGFEVGC